MLEKKPVTLYMCCQEAVWWSTQFAKLNGCILIFNHPKYLFCYLSYTYSLEWTTIQKLVSVTTETIMNEEVYFVHLPRSFSESEQREGKYYF